MKNSQERMCASLIRKLASAHCSQPNKVICQSNLLLLYHCNQHLGQVGEGGGGGEKHLLRALFEEGDDMVIMISQASEQVSAMLSSRHGNAKPYSHWHIAQSS